MIEEAAGTSMYETKKKYAHSIITKKDAKLEELNCVSLTFNYLQQNAWQ